jgi:hypothetical protein
MLYTIDNLRGQVVTPKEPWSIWREFEVPDFQDPLKLKKWANRKETKYLAYSTFCGGDETQRVKNGNSATRMIGVVADYDCELDSEEFKKCLDRCMDLDHSPQWISKSCSGGLHVLWFFEQPILCHSTDGTKRFLKRLAKELKADSIAPSMDWGAFTDPSKYYLLGHDWTKVSNENVSSKNLHLWQYETAVTSDFRKEDAEIPLDLVKEEIDRQYPGAWVGPFVEKSRGRRFWDSGSTNDTAAVVFPAGMRCFTGPQSFVSWREILGPKFVSKFESNRIGGAIQNYWFDGANYFVRKEDGGYHMAGPREAQLALRADHGLKKTADKGENLSELEKALNLIHKEKRVKAGVPFAMNKKRVVTYDDEVFFNTSTVRCIEPAEDAVDWGEGFPTIANWLEQIFGEEQLVYELSWLHYAFINAYNGEPQKGHAHFLVGEMNCGKSLYNTKILPRLFGGHISASSFLTGKQDTFNDHLFSKYFWTVDDETPNSSRSSRTSFTARVKEHVANDEFLMNGKNKQPGRAQWCGRLSITLNDDPMSLKILPDLDMSVKDKVMIFKMNAFDGFTRTFMHEALAEVPYFARYVHDYYIPDELVDVRFGVKAYIDKSIEEVVSADSQWAPVADLLRIFRMIYFDSDNKDESDWQGNPSELLLRLSKIEKAQILLKEMTPNRLGWGLRHLLKSGCEWLERSTRKGKNEWVIKKP